VNGSGLCRQSGSPSASTTRPTSPSPYRHGRDTTQRANFVAFLNFVVFTQDDDTDIVFFEVEGDARTPLLNAPVR
jgi:hypothetical protein